mmetsp:Transcript_42386/g.75970  ORF Transcript_42386/g.75970 Transcript_42386/m.75970 type:complete len:215 (-) Transcript_42386:366-1010(-)
MPNYALTPCPLRHVVVYDDIDTRYGLHGYTVVFTLRSPGRVKFEQQFHDVFTKGCADDADSTHLPSISTRQGGRGPDVYYRFPLLDRRHRGYSDWTFEDRKGKTMLLQIPCKSGAFTSTIPQSTIVDCAVWDEHGEVLWGCSQVVALEAISEGLYYELPEGAVYSGRAQTAGRARLYFELVQPGEQDALVLYALHLDVAQAWVNEWFGTCYGER